MERPSEQPHQRRDDTEFVIREFGPGDYPAMARVRNKAFSQYPMTPEELAEEDRDRDPRAREGRWVAEVDGHVVAYSGFTQPLIEYRAGAFRLIGAVDPIFRRRGIGAALYGLVRDHLAEFETEVIRVTISADAADSPGFLARRGFEEHHRDIDSELDVAAAFQAEAAREAAVRLERDGIAVVTLADLKSDPDRDRKLYELYWETADDEPAGSQYSRPPLERWVRQALNHLNRPPQGYFLAIRGDEYLGFSSAKLEQATGDLNQGMTGVRRAWRRRGIAYALKLHVNEFAKENGYGKIKTGSNTLNQAMLSLNRRLGYRATSEWIHMELKPADGT